MYRLAFVLLLSAVAHPTALGKDAAAHTFELTQHFQNDQFLHATAKTAGRKLTTGTDAGTKAAPARRPTRSATPAVERAPKTTGKGRATAKEDAARQEPSRRRVNARMSEPFPSGFRLPIVQGDTRRGGKHYDPTHSNRPLLDTSKTYRNEHVSEDFTVGEFSRSGKHHSDESRIEPRMVACLQAIRTELGQPVLVRSGYRSYWRNLEVYADLKKPPTDSQHIAGKAADIKVKGMTGLALAKVAIDSCGTSVAVGVGLEFAHVDVRGWFGAWVYENVPKRQLAEIRQYRSAVVAAARTRERAPRKGATPRRGGGLSAGARVLDTVSRPAKDVKR
jgi:uncharacterized protein YcbK (DUF882 family)